MLARPVVHDRDAREPRRRPAHGGELGNESLDDLLLERRDRQQIRAQAGERRGIAQGRRVQAVQERAAGVGVHLDQARAVRRYVKVVAHEHAEVSGRMAQRGLGIAVEAGLVGGGMREREELRNRALDGCKVLGLERDQRRGGVRNGVVARDLAVRGLRFHPAQLSSTASKSASRGCPLNRPAGVRACACALRKASERVQASKAARLCQVECDT